MIHVPTVDTISLAIFDFFLLVVKVRYTHLCMPFLDTHVGFVSLYKGLGP